MKPLLMTIAAAALLAFGSASFAAQEIANEADAAAAADSIGASARYSPAGGPSSLTLGQMIAYRINDPDLSEFKKAMETAEITKPFHATEGYMVFAPINGEFNAGDHPMDHYIVNKRYSLETMASAYDSIDNLAGESIPMNKTANKSYFIDDMRVNDVDRNPEGTVYKVGGFRDAPHL